MKYVFTDKMGEISGFGAHSGEGKRYEDCCRAMLAAGLQYLDFHPEEPKFSAIENVFGLVIPQGQIASEMEHVMADAAESLGGATGAQMHAVVNHIIYIRKYGWEKYVDKMEKTNDGEN